MSVGIPLRPAFQLVHARALVVLPAHCAFRVASVGCSCCGLSFPERGRLRAQNAPADCGADLRSRPRHGGSSLAVAAASAATATRAFAALLALSARRKGDLALSSSLIL